MKRLALLGLLLINIFLYSGLVVADDADVTVSVCRYADGMYQFSFTGTVLDWGFEGFEFYDLEKLTATGEGVRFFVITSYGAEISAYGTSDADPCPDPADEGYGPDGGLTTITKAVAPGCYEWEIQDDYGHWSNIATTCSQQEGDETFVRLVLGRDNTVTDPDRYRVWQVAAR